MVEYPIQHMTKTSLLVLRNDIDNLINTRRSLVKLNVSESALDLIDVAIDELEDAYIAEVNFQNSNR